MRTRSIIPYLVLTTVLLIIAAMLNAEGTGQIKGTITDEETKKPIVGASVMIVGTTQGAMTDFEGKFNIRVVKTGTFTLRVSHLEYETKEIKEVEVSSDLSTDLSISMRKKQSDLGVTIKVKSEHDVVDKFDVSNQVVIGKDNCITHRPVTTVDELLSQKEGVRISTAGGAHVRGGKASKTSYYPDGKPIGTPSCGQPPPAHGGSAIVNGESFDAMFFKNYGTNPFVDTEDDHLSTFAIDVDDASYIMARSYLERDQLPSDDAVRAEEFVNHFDYNYNAPEHTAFSVLIDGAPSRFGQNSQLLRIGIKGREIRPENRKAANLVFVIDVSGSMKREDRLGLVKQALKLLVNELRPSDEVGIVVYGSKGEVVLEPTSISNKHKIMCAIKSLRAGGSTYAEQGLRLGYEMAKRNLEKGKINRVILCSDGVANVGQTGADAILKQIKQYAEQGITLSSIGFGMGNYNDILLEKLGNKGNGHYAYVDDLAEARRIFVDNLTGNLQVIARDVKIQVDFNPSVVRSYRLVGYENRDVADNKFRDDKEDGGEIGAGHEVTALYELKLRDNRESSDLGTVFIRFKDPDNGEVTEVSQKINEHVFASRFDRASRDLRLAACAAEFAEILRKSYWAKGASMTDLIAETKVIFNETDSSELLELLNLMIKAKELDRQLADR